LSQQSEKQENGYSSVKSGFMKTFVGFMPLCGMGSGTRQRGIRASGLRRCPCGERSDAAARPLTVVKAISARTGNMIFG
jgi:hypothetical protein